MSNNRYPYYTNMPNKKYWKQRSKETLQEVTKDADYVEKKLSKVYKSSLKRFVNEYQSLIEPFINNNGEIDVDRLQTTLQYDITFAGKLRRVENEIDIFATELGNKEIKYVEDLLVKTYNYTYTSNLEILGSKGVEKLNKNAILQAIKMPYTNDAREFSDRIWKNKTNMNVKLKDTLTTSIAQGKSIQKTSREFRDVMGTSLSNSTRIIRTETIATYNRASVQSYMKAGLEYLEVLDTEDDRTCEICKKHNGDKVLVMDAKVGVNIPVFHPHCRCCTIPIINI